MIVAILIRAFLVLYSEIIQEYYKGSKYDDVDYSVYTDAAGYLLNGKSPYDRHTYRYTPFLAYIMVPNII
jgi:phosphatidylinositol glycan class M